jgi:hypothetical protein
MIIVDLVLTIIFFGHQKCDVLQHFSIIQNAHMHATTKSHKHRHAHSKPAQQSRPLTQSTLARRPAKLQDGSPSSTKITACAHKKTKKATCFQRLVRCSSGENKKEIQTVTDLTLLPTPIGISCTRKLSPHCLKRPLRDSPCLYLVMSSRGKVHFHRV